MHTDQIFETVNPKTITKDFSSLTEVEITALHSAGEACDSGQEGHEATDDQNRILTCTKVSEGEYRWRDTGRVRS